MTTRRTIAAAVLIGGLLVAGYSARGDLRADRARNVYYVYTAALDVNEAGAAEVPARFQWSVETSWSGSDVQGRDIDLIIFGGGIGTVDNDVELHGAGSHKQNNSLEIITAQPGDGRLHHRAAPPHPWPRKRRPQRPDPHVL